MTFASRFPFFFSVLFGTLLNVCLIPDNVWGQGTIDPPTITIPSGEASGPPLQRAPLDTVILFDEATGKRVFLPGTWPLEELDKFSDFLLREEREAVLPFTIQQIIAAGNVVNNRVETVLRIVITTSDQTVRVPLGLREGLLPFSSNDDASGNGDKESPLPYQYTGPGTFDLIVNPQDGQYVGLIRSRDRVKKDSESPSNAVQIIEDLPEYLLNFSVEPETDPKKASPETKRRPHETSTEQRHEVTLKLWFPLTSLGEEDRRLAISFPKSLSSQFRLSVPMVDAAATVSQGSLLDTSHSEDGQQTLFTIHGFKSNFDIAWSKKTPDRPENRPVLSLKDATIIARLENQSTSYYAELPISSPIAFDRVLIRLPQNAVLDPEGPESLASGSEYTLRELPDDEKPSPRIGPASDTSVYEVRFARKSISQKVRLRAIQPISADKAEAFREISGFEVCGAERQTGSLSIAIPAEMRPNWKPDRVLRRVDLPPSSLQEGIDARFDFLMQPFLLRAQIVLPQTRVNVKPEYRVEVNKGRLELRARFAYAVHGSHTDKLQFVFPDWRWIDIGPDNIIDLNGVVEKDELTNRLTVPLRAPLDGQFEVELRAFQPISLDEDAKQRLIVRLPSPNANWTEPASVVIVPADNVELIPVDADVGESEKSSWEPSRESTTPSRTVGLTRRRTLPIRMEVPSGQQDPLFYQTESISTAPVFVTDLLYHRQSVSVSVQNNVQLLESEGLVTTNLTYAIAYEPVDRIILLVPKSIDETGRWNVFLGEKPLETRDVPLAVDEASPLHWTKKRISLPPEAQIGKIPLVVRYSIPPITIERNSTATSFPISLIRPVEATVSGVDVSLVVRRGFHVELHDDLDGSWKPVDSPVLETGGSQRQFHSVGFFSAQAQERISLLLSLEEQDTQGTTVIEKAWIQTWLTDRVRMDRCVCQLTSDRESVSLQLPPGIGKEFRVLLDDAPLTLRPTSAGELVVPLAAEQQLRPVRLDVCYQIEDDPPRGHVHMALPHFDQGTVVRYAYWQLILPPNRHLIGGPTDWAPEYDWKWNGLFWGRIPSLSMGAIGFPDNPTNAPPTDASQYLFSSLYPPTSVSFYVVNRSLIVLVSSGISLLVGLALIYYPRCRYAGSLLGLGIALAAIVLSQPAPVLLVLQAASLGVCLALGASYIHRILNRDDRWGPPSRPPVAVWAPPEDASQPAEVYSVVVDESDSKKEETEEK